MKRRLLFIISFVFAAVMGTQRAQAQYSFTSQIVEYSACDSLFYRLGINTYLSSSSYDSITVLSYFGDGSTSTVTALSGTPRAYVGHHYTSPGVYTAKSILMYNGIAEDSVVYSDTINLCYTVHVASFIDANSNCHLDSGELSMPNPYTIEVDSAGVPVDTITSTSFYFAGGASGTIYAFKVLTLPSGYILSCPADSVVYDTISSGSPSSYYATIGFICDTSTFDLHVYGWFSGGVSGACSHVYAYEYGCSTVTGTSLTINYSSKYSYSSNTMGLTPTASGSTWVTLPLGTLAPDSVASLIVYFSPVGTLSVGDTTHTTWTLDPVTGDTNPSNNTRSEVDSIRSSYDPNEKSVSPQGYITAGTQLQYAVGFENTGNDTAFNIHIQDTLSADLDVNSFKLISASAPVTTEISTTTAGKHVIKFDLAHINLLDASHPGKNTGMVIFSINALSGLPNGTVINNRAGIYFDYNPVVMTQYTTNIIGTPSSVTTLSNSSTVNVYPNPANSTLYIDLGGRAYNMTIFNEVGEQVMHKDALTSGCAINISALPAGVYFVNLRSDNDVQVRKFVKE
jgi:uncharacterized repeat protein (TIGR01451 family)